MKNRGTRPQANGCWRSCLSFCEKWNDGVNLNWLNNICETDQLYPQPTQPVRASVSTSGKNAREALTQYLARDFPLRQGHLHWKQTLPKRGHYYIFAISFTLKEKQKNNHILWSWVLTKAINKNTLRVNKPFIVNFVQYCPVFSFQTLSNNLLVNINCSTTSQKQKPLRTVLLPFS